MKNNKWFILGCMLVIANCSAGKGTQINQSTDAGNPFDTYYAAAMAEMPKSIHPDISMIVATIAGYLKSCNSSIDIHAAVFGILAQSGHNVNVSLGYDGQGTPNIYELGVKANEGSLPLNHAASWPCAQELGISKWATQSCSSELVINAPNDDFQGVQALLLAQPAITPSWWPDPIGNQPGCRHIFGSNVNPNSID